ncbi:PEG3 [Symbiodinium sp. CCMP2592]|nr:PEG3 [Symbiodinium sp. CCMP2592]
MFGEVEYLQRNDTSFADTSFASSFVVTPIWAKLRNTSGTYNVVLIPQGQHLGIKILFGFGLVPAIMAVGVALCTLPCFLMDLTRGKVLTPVGTRAKEPPKEDSLKEHPKADSVKEPPKAEFVKEPAGEASVKEPQEEASVKELPAEDSAKEPQEEASVKEPEEEDFEEDPVKFSYREMEHLEQIGEKMGIIMEPVFVLQSSNFTWATDLWVTQLSLAMFAAVQLCVSTVFHLRLLLLEPFMVCIEVAEYAMILLCCISLVLGKRAAAKTTQEYAICPKTIRDLDILVLLNKHLRRMSLMPFVPTLLLIYWCAAAFVVQPMIKQVKQQSFRLEVHELWDSLCKATSLLNNECLLYCLFFKFMVDASVLARTVQSHAEAIAEKIDNKVIEEYKEFFTKGKKKDEIGTEWLDNLHISIVRLARVVLPRLGTISGPILAFAICNWGLGFLRMFRHLAVAAGDGITGNNINAATAILQVLFVHLPIGLLCLLPLAQVSDSCDVLQEKVNNLREVAHPSDIDPIDRTEAYMKGANRGQGLGYQLYGTGTWDKTALLSRCLLISLCTSVP